MAREDHFPVIALRFDKACPVVRFSLLLGFRRDNLTFFTHPVGKAK
jgi:hypothetical protein